MYWTDYTRVINDLEGLYSFDQRRKKWLSMNRRVELWSGAIQHGNEFSHLGLSTGTVISVWLPNANDKTIMNTDTAFAVFTIERGRVKNYHNEAAIKWFPFSTRYFKHIFVNENIRILIKTSLKFVPNSPINNIPALVQIMAWHRPGDKPLFELKRVSSLMHICVTHLQWVIGINCNEILSITFHGTTTASNHYLSIEFDIDNFYSYS